MIMMSTTWKLSAASIRLFATTERESERKGRMKDEIKTKKLKRYREKGNEQRFVGDEKNQKDDKKKS